MVPTRLFTHLILACFLFKMLLNLCKYGHLMHDMQRLLYKLKFQDLLYN